MCQVDQAYQTEGVTPLIHLVQIQTRQVAQGQTLTPVFRVIIFLMFPLSLLIHSHRFYQIHQIILPYQVHLEDQDLLVAGQLALGAPKFLEDQWGQCHLVVQVDQGVLIHPMDLFYRIRYQVVKQNAVVLSILTLLWTRNTHSILTILFTQTKIL